MAPISNAHIRPNAKRCVNTSNRMPGATLPFSPRPLRLVLVSMHGKLCVTPFRNKRVSSKHSRRKYAPFGELVCHVAPVLPLSHDLLVGAASLLTGQVFRPLFPENSLIQNSGRTFRKRTGAEWTTIPLTQSVDESGPSTAPFPKSEPTSGIARFLLRIDHTVRGAVEVGLVPRITDELRFNYVGSFSAGGWAIQGKGCGESQIPTKFGPGCHNEGMVCHFALAQTHYWSFAAVRRHQKLEKRRSR